ncbi:carbohydrate-binding module family 5 protein [Postia placenta MAD-698-R-SB12]|uniref:chitinase n=1 Tax=Postia placenta MAD-698-R-SB12 TaxID=670580 RepID=A0A1X6NGS5_9APHY|nr:carbohydrate-binding module family 5 protein [Postia placenta MAD-698-R-SB12]OSX67814.1 carbohydrate-binding module family 5 protein [Postia placenta MAD-698-R-SB12]
MSSSSQLRALSLGSLLLAALSTLRVAAFDVSLYDNVAVYWGQDSYGATHTDSANFQQPISYYCQDDAIDVIPIAFVDTFFGTGNYPVINLANTCNTTDNEYFSGTELLNCSFLASDIEYCQSQGKIVTISLGGAGGGVGFSNDSEAQSFADTIWDIFLGGSSSDRPFGSAVLDGIDLDIEGGSDTGYGAFITQLRTHFTGASKSYYISGAPQCEYPDQYLGSALNSAWFDMVFVQFYNNPCGLQNFGEASGWDFGLWDYWARNTAINPNVKIFIGAPASSTASGTGYQSIDNLSSIARVTRNSFPSFGGVMLWDASQAYANDRYDLAIKNALVAAGSTGFTYPPCDAQAYTSGSDYSGGTNVSYDGYIWETKYYASDTPSANYNGDWMPVSACSGGTAGSSTGSGSSSSSAASSTATTGTGNCAGVSEWSSSTAYTGGSQVQYNGDLWTAQYWTEDDTPGGSADVWTNDGACSSSDVAARALHAPTPAPVAPRRSSRFFRL